MVEEVHTVPDGVLPPGVVRILIGLFRKGAVDSLDLVSASPGGASHQSRILPISEFISVLAKDDLHRIQEVAAFIGRIILILRDEGLFGLPGLYEKYSHGTISIWKTTESPSIDERL